MTRPSFHLLALAAMIAWAPASRAAAPTIAASGAWARPTPPGASTGAVYLPLTNHGRTADSLVSATTPAAARVVFHSMSMTGGVMRMTPITAGIPIGPNGAVQFSPGGSHVMLTGLKGPLKTGAHVRVVFTFAKAGPVSVDVPVRDAAPADPMAGMKM